MDTPDGSAAEPYIVVDSPYEVANWRPLAHWAMAIPHLIILQAMRALAGAVGFVYWVMLIFTGRLHGGLYGFLAMYERYNQRALGFLFGYTEEYAPFDFTQGPADNGIYQPIRVQLPEAPETTPRTAAFNWILAIPHYLLIAVIAIGAVLVLIGGWFAVLFTGAWPQGWRDFLVRFANYYLRVWVYVVMVDTRYPRFGL